VFLTAGRTGAGWRCDALGRTVASGVVPPPSRLVLARSSSLLFGAAPPGTTRVQAVLLDLASGQTRLREIAATSVASPRTAVYVARVAADARLLTLVGLDADGRPTMRCDQETCR
jgi:hypothetical protein